MAAFRAAIGSRVRLATSSPASTITAYRLSSTSLGRKVATTAASSTCPVCPSKLVMG